jgi:hypothetical protein
MWMKARQRKSLIHTAKICAGARGAAAARWLFLLQEVPMSLVKAQEKRGKAPTRVVCASGASVAGISDDAPITSSTRAGTGLEGLVEPGDAPACIHCGSVTQRTGSCYSCMNCGSTSSCS